MPVYKSTPWVSF